MTRKITQLVAVPGNPQRLAVLCDDGSVWVYQLTEPLEAARGGATDWMWTRLYDIPQDEQKP